MPEHLGRRWRIELFSITGQTEIEHGLGLGSATAAAGVEGPSIAAWRGQNCHQLAWSWRSARAARLDGAGHAPSTDRCATSTVHFGGLQGRR